MYKRVLVLGGTGFVGKNLQHLRPNWIYFDRKKWKCKDTLLNLQKTLNMYKYYQPDAVLHLAARVGGIKDNSANQAVFFYENTIINTNVIQGAYLSNIPRVLSSLSTCAFPNIVKQYPFSEKALFSGPPAETNFSYGFTKRMLHVQSVSYRKQYDLNYSTFCPSNIYGPQDHFNSENSHFVAALVSKLYNAKDKDVLEFWGTGEPKRQQLYVKDLIQIIPLLLEKHNTDLPLIVAPKENLSILEMVNIALNKSEKNVTIGFNNMFDGQFRKDGDNTNLLKLIGDFKFTPFQKGFNETYKWYKDNL